jgi:hypothetical protein
MPTLTPDQVKSLAPDPASLKAGQKLADARHWSGLGRDAAALWGECKGSGKEPYKVRVDLSNNGTACTCPSHKFPCKHALGLMLLSATAPGKLAPATPPAWVADWLEKRAARSQAAAKKAEPKAEPGSRQKDAARRVAKREKLTRAGVETLELWLADFVRRGLAFAQSAPASFWDEQAARMVDAQLPGVARTVREMSALPGSRPDWAEILLLRLARLHLLARAYHKLDQLPEATQQDVHYLLGWTVNQDELLTSVPGLSDDWLVLDSHTEEDEKTGLRTQVNWLWGKASKRPAQILQFAFRTQALDLSLAPGLVLRGDLAYFPGAYPLRAVFREKRPAQDSFAPEGFALLSAFLDAYAAALGNNPWLEVFPVVLENVTPLKSEQNWLLCDSRKQALPLQMRFSHPWELFALSGGHPLRVFGLWDGLELAPLAAWHEGRYVRL